MGFAQAGVYTLIVVAILVVLNFLANRYNKTFDTTANKRYSLSDQTVKIATELKQPVTITYWDQPNKFAGARDLLDRYKNLSTKIDVEYSDVDKNRAKAIAAGIKTLGTITVESGARKQEAKSLTEEEITGAIVRSIKTGERNVCFTAGFGEHMIDAADSNGLSLAKELIDKNNYKTQTLKMAEKQEIPADCTVVVVPGPKRDLLAPEVAALKAYVENGGRALFMLDPPLKIGQEIDENNELAGVLDGWGVTLDKNLVLDLSGVGQLFNLGPEFPLVTAYENHPIVASLKDSATGFPITRSLETKKADKTMVDKILETTDQAIATTNLASKEIRPTDSDKKWSFHAWRCRHVQQRQREWKRAICGRGNVFVGYQRLPQVQRESRPSAQYAQLAFVG